MSRFNGKRDVSVDTARYDLDHVCLSHADIWRSHEATRWSAVYYFTCRHPCSWGVALKAICTTTRAVFALPWETRKVPDILGDIFDTAAYLYKRECISQYRHSPLFVMLAAPAVFCSFHRFLYLSPQNSHSGLFVQWGHDKNWFCVKKIVKHLLIHIYFLYLIQYWISKKKSVSMRKLFISF